MGEDPEANNHEPRQVFSTLLIALLLGILLLIAGLQAYLLHQINAGRRASDVRQKLDKNSPNEKAKGGDALAR